MAQNRIAMNLDGGIVTTDGMQMLDVDITGSVVVEGVDDLLGLVRRRGDAIVAQQLDAVPWGGVVAGGDDDAAVGAMVADHHRHARRGDHSQARHSTADRDQPRHRGALEHLARRPRVATDDNVHRPLALA